MRTEITFAMDASSSAPHIVGAILVPQAAQYDLRWLDRDGRAYVTMTVTSSIVDAMVEKVCSLHPTVRCIRREELKTAS